MDVDEDSLIRRKKNWIRQFNGQSKINNYNMKKIFQISILAMAFLSLAATTFAQKKIKEGVVKFELNMDEMGDNPEMAMLGSMSLDFYFTEKMNKMAMSMMSGMMTIQTIFPTDKPADGSILMDMLGQKIQIVEMSEEELSQSNSMMNLDNMEKVEYDEKDTKEIVGYKCYRAVVTTKEGQTMKYYITEKIQPPVGVKQKKADVLKGYPLEMEIDTGQGMVMKFVASEVLDSVSEDVFKVPDGYTKMTMEEFEKQMGEMDLGF